MDLKLFKPKRMQSKATVLAAICAFVLLSGAASAQTSVGASGASGASGPGKVDDANRDAALKALAWLKTHQEKDGSFSNFSAGGGFSVQPTTATLIAILSAKQDPGTYSQGGNTPVTFLESHVQDVAGNVGTAGYMLMAAAALEKGGYKPFGGKQSIIEAINASYNPQTGFYGQDDTLSPSARDNEADALAILGLASVVSGSVPKPAVSYIESIQRPDGGWAVATSKTSTGASNNITTALMAQALVAAGSANLDVLNRARAYLLAQQNLDGGYPTQKGQDCCGDSDAVSTAYVTQALVALGADTSKAQEYLRSLQKPSGALQRTASDSEDNLQATYLAVPALLGVPLSDISRPSGAGTSSNGSGQNAMGQPGTTTSVPAPLPGMPRTGANAKDDDQNNQVPIGALAALGSAFVLALGICIRHIVDSVDWQSSQSDS